MNGSEIMILECNDQYHISSTDKSVFKINDENYKSFHIDLTDSGTIIGYIKFNGCQLEIELKTILDVFFHFDIDLPYLSISSLGKVFFTENSFKLKHMTINGSISPYEGLCFRQIPGDGHCLYNAVDSGNYKNLRAEVASYLAANPDSFKPFFSGSDADYNYRITQIRDTNQWGDHLEVFALQKLKDCPLVIFRPDTNPIIPDNYNTYTHPPIFLYYNSHDHYDVLDVIHGYHANDILKNLVTNIKAGKIIHYTPYSLVCFEKCSIEVNSITITNSSTGYVNSQLSIESRLDLKDSSLFMNASSLVSSSKEAKAVLYHCPHSSMNIYNSSISLDKGKIYGAAALERSMFNTQTLILGNASPALMNLTKNEVREFCSVIDKNTEIPLDASVKHKLEQIKILDPTCCRQILFTQSEIQQIIFLINKSTINIERRSLDQIIRKLINRSFMVSKNSLIQVSQLASIHQNASVVFNNSVLNAEQLHNGGFLVAQESELPVDIMVEPTPIYYIISASLPNDLSLFQEAKCVYFINNHDVWYIHYMAQDFSVKKVMVDDKTVIELLNDHLNTRNNHEYISASIEAYAPERADTYQRIVLIKALNSYCSHFDLCSPVEARLRYARPGTVLLVFSRATNSTNEYRTLSHDSTMNAELCDVICRAVWKKDQTVLISSAPEANFNALFAKLKSVLFSKITQSRASSAKEISSKYSKIFSLSNSVLTYDYLSSNELDKQILIPLVIEEVQLNSRHWFANFSYNIAQISVDKLFSTGSQSITCLYGSSLTTQQFDHFGLLQVCSFPIKNVVTEKIDYLTQPTIKIYEKLVVQQSAKVIGDSLYLDSATIENYGKFDLDQYLHLTGEKIDHFGHLSSKNTLFLGFDFQINQSGRIDTKYLTISTLFLYNSLSLTSALDTKIYSVIYLNMGIVVGVVYSSSLFLINCGITLPNLSDLFSQLSPIRVISLLLKHSHQNIHNFLAFTQSFAMITELMHGLGQLYGDINQMQQMLSHGTRLYQFLPKISAIKDGIMLSANICNSIQSLYEVSNTYFTKNATVPKPVSQDDLNKVIDALPSTPLKKPAESNVDTKSVGPAHEKKESKPTSKNKNNNLEKNFTKQLIEKNKQPKKPKSIPPENAPDKSAEKKVPQKPEANTPDSKAEEKNANSNPHSKTYDQINTEVSKAIATLARNKEKIFFDIAYLLNASNEFSLASLNCGLKTAINSSEFNLLNLQIGLASSINHYVLNRHNFNFMINIYGNNIVNCENIHNLGDEYDYSSSIMAKRYIDDKGAKWVAYDSSGRIESIKQEGSIHLKNSQWFVENWSAGRSSQSTFDHCIMQGDHYENAGKLTTYNSLFKHKTQDLTATCELIQQDTDWKSDRHSDAGTTVVKGTCTVDSKAHSHTGEYRAEGKDSTLIVNSKNFDLRGCSDLDKLYISGKIPNAEKLITQTGQYKKYKVKKTLSVETNKKLYFAENTRRHCHIAIKARRMTFNSNFGYKNANLSLTTTVGGITNKGKLRAKNLHYDAKGNFTNFGKVKAKNVMGSAANISNISTKETRATIEADKILQLDATKGDINNIGGTLSAGRVVSLIAAKNVNDKGLRISGKYLRSKITGGRGTKGSKGFGLIIRAGKQVNAVASQFTAKGKISIHGERGVNFKYKKFFNYKNKKEKKWYGTRNEKSERYQTALGVKVKSGRGNWITSNGRTNIAGATFYSNGKRHGTILQGKKGVNVKTPVLDQEMSSKQSRLFGRDKSSTYKKTQTTVPTIIHDRGGLSGIISNEDVNLVGLLITGKGDFFFNVPQDKDIILTKQILEQQCRSTRIGFVTHLASLDALKGNDPTVAKLKTLIHSLSDSDSDLAVALNGLNSVIALYNSSPHLQKILQGNPLGALMDRYGRVSSTLRKERMNITSEVEGPGGIYRYGNILFEGRNLILCNGYDLIVSGKIDFSVKAILEHNHILGTKIRHDTQDRTVGMDLTGAPSVGAGMSQFSQDIFRSTHSNIRASHFHFNGVEQVSLVGGLMRSLTASGTIGTVTAISQQDRIETSIASKLISTTGDISATFHKSNSSYVSEGKQSGIFIENQLDSDNNLKIDKAFLIGAHLSKSIDVRQCTENPMVDCSNTSGFSVGLNPLSVVDQFRSEPGVSNNPGGFKPIHVIPVTLYNREFKAVWNNNGREVTVDQAQQYNVDLPINLPQVVSIPDLPKPEMSNYAVDNTFINSDDLAIDVRRLNNVEVSNQEFTAHPFWSNDTSTTELINYYLLRVPTGTQRDTASPYRSDGSQTYPTEQASLPNLLNVPGQPIENRPLCPSSLFHSGSTTDMSWKKGVGQRYQLYNTDNGQYTRLGKEINQIMHNNIKSGSYSLELNPDVTIYERQLFDYQRMANIGFFRAHAIANSSYLFAIDPTSGPSVSGRSHFQTGLVLWQHPTLPLRLDALKPMGNLEGSLKIDCLKMRLFTDANVGAQFMLTELSSSLQSSEVCLLGILWMQARCEASLGVGVGGNARVGLDANLGQLSLKPSIGLSTFCGLGGMVVLSPEVKINKTPLNSFFRENYNELSQRPLHQDAEEKLGYLQQQNHEDCNKQVNFWNTYKKYTVDELRQELTNNQQDLAAAGSLLFIK